MVTASYGALMPHEAPLLTEVSKPMAWQVKTPKDYSVVRHENTLLKSKPLIV